MGRLGKANRERIILIEQVPGTHANFDAVNQRLIDPHTRQSITAAGEASGLPAASRAIAAATDAVLEPNAEMQYVLAPAKAGDPASHSGLFAFNG